MQLYYPILFLGILAVGAVFTGTNPAYTKSELAYHFKTARVRVIISEPELISNVLGASENPNEEMPRIWTFDSLGQKIPNGFASWKTLLKHGERDWVCFDNEEKSKSTTAARLFSSGTTGLPKATVLSHCNLIAQHTLVSEAHSVPYEVCVHVWQRNITIQAKICFLCSGLPPSLSSHVPCSYRANVAYRPAT